MEDDKGTGKIRILLVDDEKDFVDTLSQRMQMRDLSADIALNGEEALEQLNKQSPDVMVLD
ncbi:MAG: response regulator, partial [Desulfobacterales bacterium]|nr:response regulator [Desulfobacterales bacterium]